MTHDQLRRTFQRMDLASIRECIQTCANARDERGRWPAERRCLGEINGGQRKAADVAAAAAARRLGAFLAGVRA